MTESEKIKKWGCKTCKLFLNDYIFPHCGTDNISVRLESLTECPNVGAIKGIITLCGSTRFYETFLEVNNKLTAQGYIVLSIGVVKDKAIMLNKSDLELENMLVELHKEKIAMSDSIFVIDVDGYIGESTKSEIEFAKVHGKKIYYYSKKDISA
jgi:hypothetical protein